MNQKHPHRLLLLLLLFISPWVAAQQGGSVRGRVVDAQSGAPIPFASVLIQGTLRGATTDENGSFTIAPLPMGDYQVVVAYVGYERYTSSPFTVTPSGYTLAIALEEIPFEIAEVVVTANPFRKAVGSPLAMQRIGFAEIDKSAGGNRDVLRILTSYPGVGAIVGAGYRNDLLVRGGGPSENSFYLEGVKIPNINHFATQGASGGAVGILNADFIREVEFFAGAFPVNRGNALSSILNFKLREGSNEEYRYKATVGASEVGVATQGAWGDGNSYLASVRHSYLQLLFRYLGLPFLPRYLDGQFQVKLKLAHQHRLTLLGVGALDNMTLNNDIPPSDTLNYYLVGSLPIVTQQCYTVGAVYTYLGTEQVHRVVASHSYLNNENEKFPANDESLPPTLEYQSVERETELRYQLDHVQELWRYSVGAELGHIHYSNRTSQLRFNEGEAVSLNYATALNLLRWGLFGTLTYTAPNEAYSLTAGLRSDATTYSSAMNNPLRQLSPRLSFSYRLAPSLFVNGNGGIFYQLPAYTTLGYKEKGVLINKANNITYCQSKQLGVGLEYRLGTKGRATLEGFYKKYDQMPLSLSDSIPLACKGITYGTVGDEAVNSTAQGQSYGVELMFRWESNPLSLLLSYTWFRSEYRSPRSGNYLPSAWDNRHLFTLTGGYQLPRRWRIGIKYRLIGGTPYTPYDLDKSSLIAAWEVQSSPYLDYSRYNEERLPLATQLDVRVDKEFRFNRFQLGFYLDIQNILRSQVESQPLLLSTGVVDASDPTRYVMREVSRTSGTLLPTVGVVVAF